MSGELAALGEGREGSGEEEGSVEGVWEEHAEALLAEMDGTTAGEPRGAGSARRGSSPRMFCLFHSHPRAHGLARRALCRGGAEPRVCRAHGPCNGVRTVRLRAGTCQDARGYHVGACTGATHSPARGAAPTRARGGDARASRLRFLRPYSELPGLIAEHACCAVPGVCRGPRGMRAARRAQQRHP